MRSACSPTRSMSFERLFVLCPNCVLALPTRLATALTSAFETRGLPMERGTGTPRIVSRRRRFLSTSPPATATAVAPTASAAPLPLVTAPLPLPTTPSFPVAFWLRVLRLEPRPAPLRSEPVFRAIPLLEREALVRLRELVFRAVPLLERELVRPPVAGFERDALSEARVERLPEEAPLEAPFALGLDRDPLDEPRLLFPLREVGSAANSLIPLESRPRVMQERATPPERTPIGMQAFCVNVRSGRLSGSPVTRSTQSTAGRDSCRLDFEALATPGRPNV